MCKASGKWADPSVPKRGWDWVECIDLGHVDAVCEMCEYMEIRFLHVLSHPEYGETLECGCICAGHMTDCATADLKLTERFLLNLAKRHATWLRRTWRVSAKGNEFLNTAGFNVAVFPKPGGWGGSVKQVGSGKVIFAKRVYSSADAAKLAAFKAMNHLKNGAVRELS